MSERPPFSPSSQDDDDDDDDNLSITSTVIEDNDSEKEWDVEDILAERQNPDVPDTSQYLVKWENFPMEDCTWEPIEHLGDGLLETWEEIKAGISAGDREAFDLAEFEAACAARLERHTRRNAKRKRLGFQLTPPFPPGYFEDTPLISPTSPTDQDSLSSDDEAQELDEVDPAIVLSSRPKATVSTPVPLTENKPVPTAPRVPKQKTFVGIPSHTTTPSDTSTSKLPENGRSQKSSQPLSTTASKTSGSKTTTPGPVRKGSTGTMTGYQGTAGRTSVFKPTTAKKPMTITTTISSTPLPKPPNAVKRLTATRTRQLPALSAATNVFAGGKQRKKRKNLADSMADPSKAPKAFQNMRMRNLAKKRGIEKGDAAGALSSIPSAFIIDNDKTKPRKPSLVSPITVSPKDQETSNSPITPLEAVSKHQGLTDSVRQQDADEAPPPKRKKSKSVHFTGDDSEELANTMNELFGSTPTQDDIISPDISTVEQGPPRTVSLAKYQERGSAQTIQKLVKFGTGEAIMVSFSGIPRHTTTWLSAFKAEETLHLASTCTSFHFSQQKGQLIKEKLAVGSITASSPKHARALKNVAEHLRRGVYGLHLVAPEYSILIYPGNCCDDWTWLNIDIKEPEDDAVLRYIIFLSAVPIQAYPFEPHEGPTAVKRNGENDLELLGMLTGLDFTKLSPQDSKLIDKQSYMILVPKNARQLQSTIITWLRTHQPDRPIFTFDQPHGWRTFHEAVQAGGGGTVISHANFTLWELEKIRGVWQMLEEGKYTFWHLDTGEKKRPQYPSDLDAVSIPGTLRLTRLFPYGRVFLITPSFVISEPAKLCDFLKWFITYGVNPSHMIVACHNFPQFLRNIAEEKKEEYNTLRELNQGNHDLSSFLERVCRSKQDIDDHIRAWQLLQQIMNLFGDEYTSEEVRKIHCLSEFIDSSDEQSLVNAFCCWTRLKCDRFRRFYVLGSDPRKMRGAYRYIEVPRYFDTEVSNPDVANILSERRSLELENQAGKHGTENNISWRTDELVAKKSTCVTSFRFPSPTFKSDDAHELQRWIDDHCRNTGGNWAVLHPKPVAWKDRAMAQQFGDDDTYKSRFDTFSSWFKAAPTFSTRRNTYYGLFYTINDTWDEFMPQETYERHAWIGIYRPKNPHILKFQQFSKIELFIWDLEAANREKNEHPLLDMQCQLVNYVHDNVAEHYPECSLSDVWYSSVTDLKIEPNDNPLDTTCSRIQEMFKNGRTELPPMDKFLYNRWTRLDPVLWTAGLTPATLRAVKKASELTPERIPQTEDDKHKPQRAIWHPPHRGSTRPTRCLNHLYETCLRARLKDPKCNQIEYRYRPTQEWWADQVEEGRGYGYVCVSAGAKIVDKLKKPPEVSSCKPGSK
ncbi:hypothetical protein F5B22DRAFT_69874 [Xylaria bambusicola]|uniref:uncharacterized protein n=1 Tax=Xylaria bambusicola TaxID=326684 RepID=UPI002007C509|nr:uncharacterized protein F5B22DRAFT_69874 [Xylaria bambusicola]KAI0518547.1 hypothetical protein F5B22DRAFT_69874 [Xylaria bambusicola]